MSKVIKVQEEPPKHIRQETPEHTHPFEKHSHPLEEHTHPFEKHLHPLEEHTHPLSAKIKEFFDDIYTTAIMSTQEIGQSIRDFGEKASGKRDNPSMTEKHFIVFQYIRKNNPNLYMDILERCNSVKGKSTKDILQTAKLTFI